MNKRYMIVGLLILTMLDVQAGDKNKSNTTKTSYFSKTMRTCAIIAIALGSQFVPVSTPQAKEYNSGPIAVGKNVEGNDVFYYSIKKVSDNAQLENFDSNFEI